MPTRLKRRGWDQTTTAINNLLVPTAAVKGHPHFNSRQRRRVRQWAIRNRGKNRFRSATPASVTFDWPSLSHLRLFNSLKWTSPESVTRVSSSESI